MRPASTKRQKHDGRLVLSVNFGLGVIGTCLAVVRSSDVTTLDARLLVLDAVLLERSLKKQIENTVNIRQIK